MADGLGSGEEFVYKYDAILAEWVEENEPLRDVVPQVVQCAFALLDMINNEKKRNGLTMPAKIVISAGKFSTVNLEEHQWCVVIGPAVDQIKSSDLVEHGAINISPATWWICDRENLTIPNTEDETTVKRPHNIDFPLRIIPRRAYLMTKVEQGNIICTFMAQRAMDWINKSRQSQDLTEIWPVTMMFMNLLLEPTEADLIDGRNKVCEIINEQMVSCRGKVCHTFIFEECCIFLCVVGLPWDDIQDKTTPALKAAHQIYNTCHQEVKGLSTISIGVTTGRVVYKLQDLPYKSKYRVYGDKVDLARKLTMQYPGIVSCDTATTLYAMLPASCLIPSGIRQHEKVCYHDEVDQIVHYSLTGGKRLALAHMQTMLEDEQMIVKSASVIGQTFSTEMLKSILPHIAEHDLIVHLKALFKVGIFKCASNPENDSSTRTCNCEPSPTLDQTPLPEREWMCRLMMFCNSDEGEMVHKLYKREEHTYKAINLKCAEYLEAKPYSCRTCGPTKFTFRHKTSPSDMNYLLAIFRKQGCRCPNQMYNIKENGHDIDVFLDRVKFVMYNQHNRKAAAGSCECAGLVETELVPRLRHWRSAGHVPRTFSYLLEIAAAWACLQQDVRALEYLAEASSMLQNLHDGKPAFALADLEDVRICKLQQAFMNRLTGEIQFKAGNISEAEECFRNALKLLNCSIPRNRVARSCKLAYEKKKKLYYQYRHFKIPKQQELERLQECIDCLSFMWRMACMRGQYTTASLVITMQLNRASKSGEPFRILHSAVDHLKYCQLRGKQSKRRCLESFLCDIFICLSDHPEGQKLISQLIKSLALVKSCIADVEKSTDCSIEAERLTEMLVRHKSGCEALFLTIKAIKDLTEKTHVGNVLPSIGKLRQQSAPYFGAKASCLKLSSSCDQKLDKMTLTEYGLTSGSTLMHLIPRLIQVFVKIEKGQIKMYDITDDETVDQLKIKVYQKEGGPVDQQRLIFDGKQIDTILHSAVDYLKYCQLKGKQRKRRCLESFLCDIFFCLSDHPKGQKLISQLIKSLALVKSCIADLEKSTESGKKLQDYNIVFKCTVCQEADGWIHLFHPHLDKVIASGILCTFFS